MISLTLGRRRLLSLASLSSTWTAPVFPRLGIAAAPSGAASSVPASPISPWTSLPPTPALPSPTASGLLETLGARLFHASFGTTGEPVLLLHGGLASSNWWGHLIPVLASHHRVFVLDTRGHGRSTLGSPPLTYPQLALDVVTLLDALGLARTAVVGWSDGGIAGLELAITAPGRVSGLFAFGANYNRAGGRTDAQAQPMVRAYEARCASEYRALAPQPAGYDRLRQALRGLWKSGPDHTPRQLSAIRTPTTIAAGEHDEFILEPHTRAMAATIPGAVLFLQPGVSHFAMLQDPSGFAAAVMRFLNA